MYEFKSSKNIFVELGDIQVGIQVALHSLTEEKNFSATKLTLDEMDKRIANLVAQLKDDNA